MPNAWPGSNASAGARVVNHPNIAAIYGLEESDSVRALVLELVEGPTLADRIAASPLIFNPQPLDSFVPFAQGQINGSHAVRRLRLP